MLHGGAHMPVARDTEAGQQANAQRRRLAEVMAAPERYGEDAGRYPHGEEARSAVSNHELAWL
jgi:hypothetical protein